VGKIALATPGVIGSARTGPRKIFDPNQLLLENFAEFIGRHVTAEPRDGKLDA
jgi:hypothetical protein